MQDLVDFYGTFAGAAVGGEDEQPRLPDAGRAGLLGPIDEFERADLLVPPLAQARGVKGPVHLAAILVVAADVDAGLVNEKEERQRLLP